MKIDLRENLGMFAMLIAIIAPAAIFLGTWMTGLFGLFVTLTILGFMKDIYRNLGSNKYLWQSILNALCVCVLTLMIVAAKRQGAQIELFAWIIPVMVTLAWVISSYLYLETKPGIITHLAEEMSSTSTQLFLGSSTTLAVVWTLAITPIVRI